MHHDLLPVAQQGREMTSKSGFQNDYDGALNLAQVLSGPDPEAEAYLEWLRCRAENLVTKPPHWKAIDALAKALLIGGTLMEKEARSIIRGSCAYPRTLKKPR